MIEHTDAVGRSAHVRLTFLILEGYVYLALIAGTFLAMPAFLVWGLLTQRPFIAIAAILIAVPVTTMAARALRVLWFAFPEPEGVEVGPNLGARLHQEVQDIAQCVGAPRVHRIVVSAISNASAAQAARVGVFWPRNIVVVGYPLLVLLSVDQVRAVIAHELAHLTYAHGQFASWVHRTRLTWVRLLAVLQRHQSVPAHVYRLFRFYVPRLHARAASISRQQEFLADRLAAGVTGSKIAAQTLVAIALAQHLVEDKFWPQLDARVESDPKPPDPFSRLGPDLWNTVEDRARLLDRLIEADTTASDTHPALRDRLAALGEPPQWPDPADATAADYFLGSQRPQVTAALDRLWQDAHGRAWQERHAEIRARRQRLQELAGLSAPTAEQIYEHGLLQEDEGNEDAALRLYSSADDAGHPPAGLAAGRMLLERGNESGIARIDAAMTADAALVEDGCDLISDFLQHRGRHVDAFHYQQRMAREATRSAMAQAEQQRLSAADRLSPCVGQPLDIEALARQLGSEPGVQRAFLVVKELRYAGGTQMVLALLADGSVAEVGERLRRNGLLPESVTVAAIGRHDQGVEAALATVPGALIYDGAKGWRAALARHRLEILL